MGVKPNRHLPWIMYHGSDGRTRTSLENFFVIAYSQMQYVISGCCRQQGGRSYIHLSAWVVFADILRNSETRRWSPSTEQ